MSDDDYETAITPLVTTFWQAIGSSNEDLAQETLEMLQMVAPPVAVARSDEEDEGTSMKDHEVPAGTGRNTLLALNAPEQVTLALIGRNTCGAIQGLPAGVGKFCLKENCALLTHAPGSSQRATVNPQDLVVRHRETSTARDYAFTYPRLDSDSLPLREETREEALEMLLDLQAPPKVWMLVIGGASHWIASEAVSQGEDVREQLRRLREAANEEKEEEEEEERQSRRVFLDEEESEEEGPGEGKEDEDEEGWEDDEDDLSGRGVEELVAIVKEYKKQVGKLVKAVGKISLANEANEKRIREVSTLEEETYEACREAVGKVNDKVKTLKALLSGSSPSGGGAIDLTRQRKLVVELIRQQGVMQWNKMPPKLRDEKSFEKILTEVINTVLSKGGLLSLLDDRVHQLESRTTEAIEIAGHNFKNQEEVELFFGVTAATTNTNLTRMVMDMKNMLLLTEPAYTTPSSGIEATADALKGGFANTSEGIIMTGFDYSHPTILLKESAKPQDQRDGGVGFADRASDPAVWIGGHLGSEKDRVLSGLERVKNKVLALIKSEYPLRRGGRHAEINAVLTTLVNEAYTHAVGLIQSMEPLYKTLTQGGMSSKESWRRVKLYVKGVFDSIHEVRGLAGEGTRGAMMWAVLSAHRIGCEYHSHQWINHPRVSSILALSALEHEGDTIATLEKEVEAIKKDLKSVTDKLLKLTRRVEVIEGKAH
eukprot:scaffold14397_cov80-Skeletonema_menzelii.AAC.2